MRAAHGLLICSLLLASGCGEAPVSNPGAGGTGIRGFLSGAKTPSESGQVAKPLAKVALAGGDVVVAGPEGYCIDPKTRKAGVERGFAALASCQILTGGQAGPLVSPVLMTVTVGPRGDDGDLPTPDLLAQFQSSQLLSGERRGGLVLANLAQGGATSLGGGDARHWRGVFLQGGRIVGLALYAPEGSSMTGSAGGRLLAQLHARIVALSPKAPAAQVSAAEQAVSAPEEKPRQGTGFLARLLRP